MPPPTTATPKSSHPAYGGYFKWGVVRYHVYQATLRLDGASPYARLTDAFEASIALWCLGRCDLLFVRCPAGETASLLDRIEGTVGVGDATVDGGDAVVVTDRCADARDEPTVDDYLADHDCLLVPPIRYERGARRCRVLGPDADRLAACYRTLRGAFDVTVETKGELDRVRTSAPPLGAGDLDLTPRQREVVVTAYEEGYYELPRETTMEAVADRIGIDRRTADEHRRRAERKLLDAFVERRLG